MKKLLLAIFILLIGTLVSPEPVTAQATQSTFLTAFKSSRSSLALDTLAKDSTRYLVVKTAIGSKYASVAAYASIIKISGTVGGTITLEGSPDGTKWYPASSAVTITDATANYRIAQTPLQDKYLRLKLVGGAAVMSASFGGSLYAIR